jgi:hypothetical protein
MKDDEYVQCTGKHWNEALMAWHLPGDKKHENLTCYSKNP